MDVTDVRVIDGKLMCYDEAGELEKVDKVK